MRRLNPFTLAAGALAAGLMLAGPGSAKEECPTLHGPDIVKLLQEAPSCERAAAIFEACAFGAGGDIELGATVVEKCEGDFLAKLNRQQRQVYDREQKRCARKFQNKSGTMYRSAEAFCCAGVAQSYSRKFLKAKGGAPSGNPPAERPKS